MSSVEDRFRASVQYLNSNDRLEVERALEKVKVWHRGQKRESGQPFVEHPIATANYLAKLECAKYTLIAGLCHDTVEDNCATL
ncbi:(p)ppGpp synthetase, partial [Candidatus Peregrinibacteria bacterium CG10_big_fil_rev_8_21_14_0_10_49_16]